MGGRQAVGLWCDSDAAVGSLIQFCLLGLPMGSPLLRCAAARDGHVPFLPVNSTLSY